MTLMDSVMAINSELTIIDNAKNRVKIHVDLLNQYNPFKIGEILIGNDRRHNGKKLIVDRLFVGNQQYKDVLLHPDTQPIYFIAEGIVLKKNDEPSNYRTIHYIKIN